MYKNLISNSGFELYDSNGLVDWICDTTGLIDPDLLICPIRNTSQKHTDLASAYLNVPGTLDRSTGHIQQHVDVLPNTEYIFSSWFKVEGFGGSIGNIHPAINLTELDFNYQSIGFYHPEHIRYYSNTKDMLINIPRPLSFDWTYIDGLIRAETGARSKSFITSPWTYHIVISIGAWQSYGKIWFDDLDLHSTCELSKCDFTITQ